MTEDERRLQISLRMKAGRMLAGDRGRKGIGARPIKDIVGMAPMLDERISANRLEDIEQASVSARRGELEAFIKAIGLPDEWFDGLYPSDQGQAVSETLGAVLLALAEAAREHPPALASAPRVSRAKGRRSPGQANGAG